MINASKEFKKKLKDGANCVNYADIALSNGTVLHLEPKDFMIGGCTIEDKTTDGKFGVGFVIGKTLTLRIANHDERFSQYDFYNSIINLYIALALDDGTIEKIRKGVYYTTVPETPGDIIEISAVDGMFKLDMDYSASTTVYPATLQTILSDACLDCGIPIGFRQFDNMSFIVKSKPEKATYRQVVSYAAQIAGYNARIDNDGYMQLVWYNTNLLDWYNYNGGNFKTYPHDTIIYGGDFKDYSASTIISGGNFTDEIPEHIFRIKSLSVSTDDVQITGVRVNGEDGVSVLFGEEGYLIEVKDNPFAYGSENQIANYLGKRIVGIVFRPFSADILNNPLYEPYEVVKVSDRKGNAYLSVLNSISYTIGSYTHAACEAEDPVRNGGAYFSEAAAAVVEARRDAKKQITAYDKAVQSMNQLAMNAMGYHTTYEDMPDGSRITYLHDKPTLEDSTTIYKQTIDGFFISTDGGKSYTAGFDKNGNAVFNILYAIGIVCDWIRGGTLTLGGIDNVNGVFRVLDASGNVVCEITNEGLISKQGNLNDAISGAESRITQTEKGIELEARRATEAEGILDSKITVTADGIKTEVTKTFDGKLESYSTIVQTDEKLEMKVGKGDISSEISQEPGKISIRSNRLSIDSDNFKLTESGAITSTSGTIGGFTISESKIYAGDADTGVVAMQRPGDKMRWVFAAGGTSHSSYADCPFRVSKAGELYATNAEIKGKITADSMTIGSGIKINGKNGYWGNCKYISDVSIKKTETTTTVVTGIAVDSEGRVTEVYTSPITYLIGATISKTIIGANFLRSGKTTVTSTDNPNSDAEI